MTDIIKNLSRAAAVAVRAERGDLPPFDNQVLEKVVELRAEYDRKLVQMVVETCAEIADEGFGSAHFGMGVSGNMLKDHFGL